MVTLYDSKPVPKAIDFGVAKATRQKLTERTLFTNGTMVGTLEHESRAGRDERTGRRYPATLFAGVLCTSCSRQHAADPPRMKEASVRRDFRMIKEEKAQASRGSRLGGALASSRPIAGWNQRS